jgi:TPR repeat protein
MRFVLGALCICASFAIASASDLNDPTKETFDRGVVLYDAGRYEEAFKIFSSIEDENLAAMNNVAFMLRKGQGTKKDPQAAEETYERAAEGGNPRSQADLGEMLMNGEAGAPDPKAAAGWLTLASAAHHPIAEFELGELYEAGSGVTKNLDLARELFEDAAARGVPGAREHLAQLPPAAATSAPTPLDVTPKEP